jgi:hypothetical protein
VRDKVSHPYKTTGEFIVLYILIFTFLDSRTEDKIIFTILNYSIDGVGVNCLSYFVSMQNKSYGSCNWHIDLMWLLQRKRIGDNNIRILLPAITPILPFT